MSQVACHDTKPHDVIPTSTAVIIMNQLDKLCLLNYVAFKMTET